VNYRETIQANPNVAALLTYLAEHGFKNESRDPYTDGMYRWSHFAIDGHEMGVRFAVEVSINPNIGDHIIFGEQSADIRRSDAAQEWDFSMHRYFSIEQTDYESLERFESEALEVAEFIARKDHAAGLCHPAERDAGMRELYRVTHGDGWMPIYSRDWERVNEVCETTTIDRAEAWKNVIADNRFTQ
jgi:hypothetical protein